MVSSRIEEMVAMYEHKSSYGSEPHFAEIKELGDKVLPYFLEAFPKAKRWRQRASFIYRATSFAKTSDLALELAFLALSDRSSEVRYRACMLIACSLNKDALPRLKLALLEGNEKSRPDILAAIDAIESENHNYFLDRSHTGKVTLGFGE